MARGARKVTLPHPVMEPVNMENRPTEAEMQEAFDAADAAKNPPPADPPLPPGVATGTTKAATVKPPKAAAQTAGNGEASNDEPDEGEDLPQGARNNPIAIARKKLYDKARDLGQSKILGERSLLALAELAVTGAAEGYLTVDRGDADELYKRFRDPNTGLKKARYVSPEVNAHSMAMNITKLGHFMELGTTFHDDGVQLFNTAHDVYKSMIADEEKRQSMKYTAAYEAVLSVVRSFMLHVKEQAKKKVTVTAAEMPDAEAIENSLFKPDKDQKDAIAILADAYNAIDKANEGQAAEGKKQERLGLKDDRLHGALEVLRDVAKDQGVEQEERFLKLTTKGAKKVKATETTGEEAQADANAEANADAVEGAAPAEVE